MLRKVQKSDTIEVLIENGIFENLQGILMMIVLKMQGARDRQLQSRMLKLFRM